LNIFLSWVLLIEDRPFSQVQNWSVVSTLYEEYDHLEPLSKIERQIVYHWTNQKMLVTVTAECSISWRPN
jgi:hypothetical protein